nr:MAG TPA: hypothetical protein [Bacteriophage sp.]
MILIYLFVYFNWRILQIFSRDIVLLFYFIIL